MFLLLMKIFVHSIKKFFGHYCAQLHTLGNTELSHVSLEIVNLLFKEKLYTLGVARSADLLPGVRVCSGVRTRAKVRTHLRWPTSPACQQRRNQFRPIKSSHTAEKTINTILKNLICNLFFIGFWIFIALVLSHKK